MRRGICDLSERTKAKLLTVLQQPDDWKTAILVHAQTRAADLPDTPAARLNFSQTGFGLKLQLDLTIPSEVNAPAIQRELLCALLLEFMYRDAPDTPAGTPYAQAPAWLVDGLLAAGSERNSDSGAVAVAQNTITSLPEFLSERPELLESAPRAVYREYAGALLSMLIDLPNGRVRLAKLIADLPQAGSDPVADLQKHFAEIGGDTYVLQQRWTNAVTRVAARGRYRMMTCEETERQLATLLTIPVAAGKAGADAYALEQYAEFIRLSGAPEALRRLSDALLRISARANPLYAPIIAEYQQITYRLARRKTAKIAERLTRVRAAREEMSRRMSAIDDYMNWFEATQSGSPSGAFEDYMKAAELSAERQPRRRDPISVYLDALEAQLSL